MMAVGLPVTASFWWPDENMIRRAGLVLQVLGICTVVWGIGKTRKLFGHPSFWRQARQRFHQWLHDRPKYRRNAVVGVATGSLAVAGARARASVWSNAGPDATPEQRMDALEKNLKRIMDNLAEFQENTFNEFAKRDDAIKQEQQTRAASDHDVRELLTVTETGGLNISMVGAILLLLGVAMSTIPAELGDHLRQPMHCFVLNTSSRCE
jgi:hypothetical protein